KQNLSTPLIMLGLTILSVFLVGVLKWEKLSLNPLIIGAYYVISLMGIVGIHEIGHMVASRLHGIKASWPYFIPIPIGLGTLGAFISQKTPIKSKNDLFDVGLSGPIFGLVAATAFSIVGFLNTIFVSTSVNLADSTELGFGILMNDPNRLRILLFEILRTLLVPQAGANTIPVFHPFAYAGWVGFLITGINLIPIGQSDGGHIARSLFSEKNHRIVTYISAGILFILGFWFFALLLLYMYSQTGHAGPLDDLTELSNSRKIGAVLLILLILLCLPIPSGIFSIFFPGL
ncbi:MAG: site-2 protease family protein, partial [Candidatus Hodarchaeales archaeon]